MVAFGPFVLPVRLRLRLRLRLSEKWRINKMETDLLEKILNLDMFSIRNAKRNEGTHDEVLER
jgi:hypothetical protein